MSEGGEPRKMPGRRPAASDGVALARALRAERAIMRVRWAGVAFGIVQVLTYYIPYPPGMIRWALAFVALLAVGNLVVMLRLRSVLTLQQARRLGIASLALDMVFVMGLVFVYTFDPETAMWAVVYVLPLEAATRFQLRGALVTMGVATVLYTLREAYGTAVHGNDFLPTSITFRMGIGWIIAWVAGGMASSLVRDRSELEQAKEELERAAAELESANAELATANEIKDDFLAMTNHELRTPLTTILGYTSMLRRRWEHVPDASKQEFVLRIEEQGVRLREMVEGLLTLSSAQAGALQLNLQAVDVSAAVDEAILHHGLDGTVFVNECTPGTFVLADRVRLGQVLVNYLTNARKYGEPPISVSAWDDGEGVSICVSDEGPGVPSSFVPSLFDKFSQASIGDSRTAEGTGLGLAIVRQLAEAQGGQAWYEDNEPKGSRFLIRLMRAPNADARPVTPARQTDNGES
jgi:signal transduction histidine kinase